ncbi:IclR family transcriptional regulator [Desulfosporosinus sp.]|uniref:IclR family transcriptional regulator n=1 Tax=Desulfosporosinus sp. TaxID=157907 RepID=UPI0025B938B0|nr:IclR family transcriptional regulator [Desulfosporosinus sp.]MBC2721562.1 IclR family transcriptional regulator [Desulfosporosinus sp.]MBC2727026.1 IclR family transcriptional regulator [Desulfosporosinus sp.]
MEWLDRMTMVMDSICEASMEGLGVTELVNRTQLSKGTLHRMLTSMVKHNLVSQNSETKKYRLGPKSMVWGSKFLAGQDTFALLTEYCDLLAERTGLYTHLCRFDAGEVYCVYTRQPSEGRTAYFVHVGQRMPLHCTAAAKAILAYQPPSAVASLFAKEQVQRYTDFTKLDLQDLRAELDEVAQTRVAYCVEEIETGVSAISTPVFHKKGEAHFSIGLLEATQHLDSRRDSLVKELLEIGEKASERMAAAYLLTSTGVGDPGRL